MRKFVWFSAMIALANPYCSKVSADTALQARVCVSRQEMSDICGTASAKLVFINGTTLYYVDFSQDTPGIVPLTRIQGGIAPVISPSGTQVAYAVAAGNFEYNTALSAAWVCTLSASGVPFMAADPGFVPRFVKNAAAPTLIYSTCGKKLSGKNYLWDGCGSTVERTVENSPGPEDTIWAGGSYNGGISRDNRYLSTAESSPGAFVLDLDNSSGHPDTLHKFLVKNHVSGNDTAITVQVCNLSSTSSKLCPRAVMYLDFSSSAFTYANCATPAGLGSWGLHERIFISAVSGSILRYYDVPQDVVPITEAKGIGEAVEKEWDFPEWSNHPYFAAASVLVNRLWLSTTWDNTYAHEQIYCINLKDSTYHKIIETTDSSKTSATDMEWPWLWTDVPADFQEDSTWLKALTPIRGSFSINNASGRVFFDGRTIKSAKPIIEVSVYSLRGEAVQPVCLANSHEYRIAPFLQKKVRGGVYCMRVKTIDGHSTFFRCIPQL